MINTRRSSPVPLGRLDPRLNRQSPTKKIISGAKGQWPVSVINTLRFSPLPCQGARSPPRGDLSRILLSFSFLYPLQVRPRELGHLGRQAGRQGVVPDLSAPDLLG